MTDIAAAWTAIRARAEAELDDLPLFLPDRNNRLPDDPATFLYLEIVTERAGFLEIGGGRGSNRFRNAGELHGYVFVPVGSGLEVALAAAEPVATAFRSWRGSGVIFDGASVSPLGEGAALVPPGLGSAAGNYSCAVVIAPFHFDQTG